MLAKKALSSMLAVLLLTFTSQVYAQTQPESANERSKTNEGYAIHYNTLNTTFLMTEVAKKYGITRSKNRAMLNVSVRKGGGLGKFLQTQAVKAKVTVQATNLANQLETINMWEVLDGDAIYYIGTFAITDEETFKFTITVDPENKGSVHEIKFRQQFFVD